MYWMQNLLVNWIIVIFVILLTLHSKNKLIRNSSSGCSASNPIKKISGKNIETVDVEKLETVNNTMNPNRSIHCLIIGCNYEGTSGELFGCQNDASLIAKTITNYHYNLTRDLDNKDNLYIKYLLDKPGYKYPT